MAQVEPEYLLGPAAARSALKVSLPPLRFKFKFSAGLWLTHLPLPSFQALVRKGLRKASLSHSTCLGGHR